MKNKYLEILETKFNTPLKKGCFHYGKMDTPHIVLYKWDHGFFYRAPYKCLNKNMNTLESACDYIESKFDIKEKRGEYHLFTDTMDEINVEGLLIRELNFEDESIIEEMKQECAIDEVELAQITIHDQHVLGGFINGKLIGLSSTFELWGAYDVGILVHPDYRKKGVSSALVARNAKWTLSQNKICMYRCDDFNIGSYKTAQKLGFKKEVDIIVYELKR